MKNLHVFLYEWKHFVRSPFKVVALVLFMIAGVYGLHNGASLYHKQTAEIEKIKEKIQNDRSETLGYYELGVPGPESRPWVDLSTPFWAIWYSGPYHFKTPSPALVYSMGQAEQYGFYKRVSFQSSPYDADMTKEIANPERLQTGTLDFSFVMLFLLPLLLLISLYNLNSMEAEQGFLPLIQVQTSSRNAWLLSRVSFYVVLHLVVIGALLVYGGMLTGVFSHAGAAFGQMLGYSFLYLLFWSVIYYLFLRSGTTIMGNTLKMVGAWIFVAFIIPAIVHQWVSIEKPANLMTEFIDASRDGRQELAELPDSVFHAKVDALFPEIKDSPLAADDIKKKTAYLNSGPALVNELLKESTKPIEEENQNKNILVSRSYWFNPLTYFQNRFNFISETHYNDYQEYRNEIQVLIDKQIRTLVLDNWNAVKVDKNKFQEYNQTLSQL
ncbi:MAG: hypothetical protein AAGC85_02620 [Bacteroidota bacterium]